jgi:hypothetical protein
MAVQLVASQEGLALVSVETQFLLFHSLKRTVLNSWPADIFSAIRLLRILNIRLLCQIKKFSPKIKIFKYNLINNKEIYYRAAFSDCASGGHNPVIVSNVKNKVLTSSFKETFFMKIAIGNDRETIEHMTTERQCKFYLTVLLGTSACALIISRSTVMILL